MMAREHADEEQVHRYLTGALSEDERDAFEGHFFECPRCLDDIKRHWAMQVELHRAAPLIDAAPSRTRPWVWFVLAPAVAVLLAVFVVRQAAPRRPAAAPPPRANEGSRP